ncbi:hypothetical protein [Aeromicrobium camelliae]
MIIHVSKARGPIRDLVIANVAGLPATSSLVLGRTPLPCRAALPTTSGTMDAPCASTTRDPVGPSSRLRPTWVMTPS